MASRSAKPEPAPAPGIDDEEPVLVGRALRPHGLRGEVKIEILSDVPDRFEAGAELLLAVAGQPRRTVQVASFRRVGGGGVIRFRGFDDRDRAEGLRGAEIEVARSSVPAAPDGLYYHFELVGCRCVDASEGELGVVTAVIEDGGGVLLEVAGGGRTVLVPFVEDFLESVDVAGKHVRLRLPPGLVESCASGS